MTLGIKRLVVAGSSIGLLVVMAIAAPSTYVIFGPMLLFGFGNGLILPSAMAGSLGVVPEAAGAAARLRGACQLCVAAIASTLSAMFTGYTNNGVGMIALMFAFALASWCFALAARPGAGTE